MPNPVARNEDGKIVDDVAATGIAGILQGIGTSTTNDEKRETVGSRI